VTATPALPAAFLGHGNPMNALERNRYTDAWRTFGAAAGRPRAILVVSAHWFINATAVTAMPQPRTIHDFYGFPRELFAFEYPAPGDPELAEEIADLVKPDRIGMDRESWGLDHGAWSVLAHAFPEADVPVVQLSINALKPFDYHLELASRLAPLRERGVVIVGSGNLVHNLQRVEWDLPETGFPWAQSFDQAARAIMTERPGEVAELEGDKSFRLVAPTPDHFIPLLYIAALCDAAGEPAEVLVDGYAYGSISMTCFTTRMKAASREFPGVTTTAEPPNDGVPADQTNI
jgi:4,5-DOPA dioxygenase extradiol